MSCCGSPRSDYSLWRCGKIFEASWGPETTQRGHKRTLKRLGSGAKAVIYLALGGRGVSTAAGSTSSRSNSNSGEGRGPRSCQRRRLDHRRRAAHHRRRHLRSAKAGGLDTALQTPRQRTFGPVLLALTALGVGMLRIVLLRLVTSCQERRPDPGMRNTAGVKPAAHHPKVATDRVTQRFSCGYAASLI